MSFPTRARVVDPEDAARLERKVAEARAERERERFWELVRRRQNERWRARLRDRLALEGSTT